jgi:hypothetical protein
MTDHDTTRKPDRLPGGSGLGKSIFPTFDINVPMPRDTAVPGSYNKPAGRSSPGAPASQSPKGTS